MMSPFANTEHRRVLITDFDGTMTRVDFFERALERYPRGPGADSWQACLEGRKSQFEGLHGIFAALPADEQLITDIAQTTGLDDQLSDAIAELDAKGWGVVVASTGCEWYINKLFDEAGVHLPIVANPGEIKEGLGLYMTANEHSPYFCRETGVDKAAIVREAMNRFDHVAFAGNGQADFPAIRLVEPTRRFARGWLAQKLRQEHIDFQPFERWSEIVPRLE